MGLLHLAGKAYRLGKKAFNRWCIIRTQKLKMKDSKRQEIVRKVTLLTAQKEEIQQYYQEHYGRKISLDWHKYYQGISGSFAVEYIPELLYSFYENMVNPEKYAYVYSDKILQYQIISGIPNVKTAELYLFCRNHVWYDNHFCSVTLEKAVNILKNKTEIFYKPINDTNSGIGCGIYETTGKSDAELVDFLQSHTNILVQQVVKNSNDVRALHPNSLNTFRIMTYSIDGQVYHCPGVLRIGRKGNSIDNAHAGGIFVGIDDSGRLKSTAHTEFGELCYEHPDTKIAFSGYQINKVAELLSVLEQAHNYIQHLGVISWDVVIDDTGEFVIIEINTMGQSTWLVQMANGCGLFEENTPAILKKLRALL